MLLQLIVILAATRLFGALARRVGQAEVIGEVLAGVLLGPSLLGHVAPDIFSYVFVASNEPTFAALSQLGLILLMFQIGLDFELSTVRTAKRTVALVSVLSIVVPFGLGSVTSTYFYNQLAEPRPPSTSFLLIFAVSMSITALPVLGRIFAETGLSKQRAGVIAITAAAFNDVIGWLLIGAVSLLVAGNFSIGWVGVRSVGILTLCGVTFFLVRPLVHRYITTHLASRDRLEHAGISLVLLLLFAIAFITSALGIHALIGGFILGVALHQHEPFVLEWRTRISPLVNTLLLPIFFAHTGLRTDVGTTNGSAEIVQCVLICGVAFLGKYGGSYLGARLAGEPPQMAHVLAVCMNTRGLMELVVLNIGHDLGILPKALFTQLVYMALISTLIATPLIRRYLRSEPAGPQT